MSPEEHDYLAAEARARKRIDEKLAEAGWKVQDRAKANLYAGQGVALRELVHGEGHERSGRRPPLRGCDEDPLAGFVTR